MKSTEANTIEEIMKNREKIIKNMLSYTSFDNAEDIFQDSIIEYWIKNREKNFKNILIQKTKDFIRTNNRRRNLLKKNIQTFIQKEDPINHIYLKTMLEKLSDKNKSIITMKLQGYTNKEIGIKENISSRSVIRRIKKSVKNISSYDK